MTKSAKQIGPETISGSGAVQRLYRLSEPLEGFEFIKVSAVESAFDTMEPETSIFGCHSGDGVISDWAELTGSYQGGTDHFEALRRAGYVVKPGVE